MKLGVFIGTRPEIISLSTVLNSLPKKKFSIFLFDVLEESGWFEKGVQYLTLGYSSPKKTIKWSSYQKLYKEISQYIEQYELDLLLTSDYSKTVLVSTYIFRRLDLPSIHIGSGFRKYSYDYDEFLRQTVDKLTPFHLTMLEIHKRTLVKEGFPSNQIEFIGSPSVDAVLRNMSEAIKKSTILDELYLDEEKYYVAFLNYTQSSNIIDHLVKVADEVDSELIVSLPKSLKKKLIMEDRYYEIMEKHDILFIEVLDFLDYITISYYSKGILTDSYWLLPQLVLFKKPIIFFSEYNDPYNLEGFKAISRISPSEVALDKLILKNIEHTKPRVNILPYFGNGEATEKAIEFIEEFSDAEYKYPPQELSIMENNTMKSLPMMDIKEIFDGVGQ